MFRRIWVAKREIAALFDTALEAAKDRKITPEEAEALTQAVLAVVQKMMSEP